MSHTSLITEGDDDDTEIVETLSFNTDVHLSFFKDSIDFYSLWFSYSTSASVLSATTQATIFVWLRLLVFLSLAVLLTNYTWR